MIPAPEDEYVFCFSWIDTIRIGQSLGDSVYVLRKQVRMSKRYVIVALIG